MVVSWVFNRIYALVITNIANLKMAIEIVNLSIENGDLNHSCVSLTEGML